MSKILLPLLTALFIVGCDRTAEAPPPPKPSVQISTVKMEAVTPRVEFVGRTSASRDISIKAKVRGTLLDRHFNEGSNIEKDSLLFEIDPEQYEAQLAQAQANRAQAKAAYDTAVINFRRGQQLIEDNFISGSDYDKLESTMLQTRAALSSADAELENARLELSYTKIHAPISGRISRAFVFSGDLISPEQTEMATLVQLQPAYVNFQAPEKVLSSAARRHQEAEEDFDIQKLVIKLRFPTGDEFEETGMIDFVDNRVDPTTGTLAVRASFPNEQEQILPGQFVTVIIQSPVTSEVMLIPQKSVQEDQQGFFVMAVDDKGMVMRKNVQLGERYGVDWEVQSGLESGDQVIVEGLQKVRAGIEVEFTEAESQPFES